MHSVSSGSQLKATFLIPSFTFSLLNYGVSQCKKKKENSRMKGEVPKPKCDWCMTVSLSFTFFWSKIGGIHTGNIWPKAMINLWEVGNKDNLRSLQKLSCKCRPDSEMQSWASPKPGRERGHQQIIASLLIVSDLQSESEVGVEREKER